MRRNLAALGVVVYLTCVALAIAAIWTSRGNDLSAELGATAGVLFGAGLFGAILVGLALGA